MKKLLVCLIVLVALPLFSADRGTPAEAKALLEKAVAHYNDVGRAQALADFNNGKPPWKDRDLYVFCADSNHILVANGGYPQYVGMSGDLLKDVHGRSVGRAGAEIAEKKGFGTVEYDWLNPVTQQMERKISFFQKAGDDVCGVGAYNPR